MFKMLSGKERALLRIVLAYQSSLPIYEQIKEQLKASIFAGELDEDALLPPIRKLARELKVSVITITRAYNDLEIEGFIVTVPGKGCYVKKIDDAYMRQKYIAETKATLAAAIKQGKMAGLTMAAMHNLLDEVEE